MAGFEYLCRRMKHYLSLVKFAHTIFALPFALAGYFMAVWRHHYGFDAMILLLVVLCMVFARNAAMAFNRLADRKYDRLNPRTAQREIPRGLVSTRAAAVFVFINSALFIACTWFINPLCFYLSPVALAVILLYSYTKRFTALSHFILGLGLSLAPVGAYLAVSGRFHYLPVLLSLAVLGWVSGFDIIYALQDDTFDREKGLHSIPARAGRKKALAISSLVHMVSGLALLAIGWLGGFHWLYWIGTSLFLALLVYQHTLVKPNDLSRVNLAFFTTNGVASVMYAVFFIAATWFSA